MKPASPALLALLAAGLILGGAGRSAQAETPPSPPGRPRFAEGPDYDRCLDLVRTDPGEARNFAEAWEIKGGGEGARHCGALALLAAGEPERAAERLEGLGRASQAEAAMRASLFAQAGQAWMLAGESGRAYAAATMGLTLAPDDAELMLDRAVALGTLGRYADAMDDLNRLVALDPQRAEVWVFRAAANRHLNKVDQAAEDVGRAITLAPDNAEALLERGIIRQIKGDRTGAKADWRRAIALAPDSATAELAQQNLALNEAAPRRR